MKREVLIKSCQKNKDRQKACEETWVSYLRENGIKVWILEGGHRQYKIRGDCIYSRSFDGYMGNTIKVREGLRLLLTQSDFTHLFICDDDTFIHPKRWLEHLPEGPFECLHTEKHPWAHGGGGWWMDRLCCQLYVKNVKEKGSWDDVLAYHIAERNQIPIINRPDLYSQWTDRVSLDNNLITCHEVNPAEMRILYDSFSL